MKIKSLVLKVLGIAAVLIVMVVAALSLQPATVAYATDPYLDTSVPSAKMTDKDIEAMFKHEVAWMTSQKQVFSDAYELSIDFQALIDLQVKKKRDSAELDVFMSTFDTALLDAQSVHDAAAKVIGTWWGFDAQGHVTNRTAALQTVTDARYYLRDAHYRLRVAIHALHRSYADWHYKIIHPNNSD
jgi:hypothetical protein